MRKSRNAADALKLGVRVGADSILPISKEEKRSQEKAADKSSPARQEKRESRCRLVADGTRPCDVIPPVNRGDAPGIGQQAIRTLGFRTETRAHQLLARLVVERCVARGVQGKAMADHSLRADSDAKANGLWSLVIRSREM
jgi:hypothetical protein